LRFALDIHDCGGGQWTCHCDNCRFDVQRGLDARAEMTFRMDAQTLADLIHGKQTTQQAFFDGRIELLGDMEKALKFAMLIEQFFTEKAQSPARRLRILEGVT
jgi:putative sterol carrier protein